MKKIILILTLLLFINSMAQKKNKNNFSISLTGIQPISIGNNFLAKGYEKSPAFALSMQYNSDSDIFIGLEYQNISKANVNSYWLGNFKYATSQNYILFGGYFHLLNEKIYLEHRLGIGITEIVHEGGLSRYKIDGKRILIGSKLNYKLNETFVAFSQLDFVYSYYDIEISGPEKSFYSTGLQLMPAVGIRVNFASF